MTTPSDDEKRTEQRALQAFGDAVAYEQGEPDSGAFRTGDDISPLVYAILKCLGEDPAREGLRKTPTRADKALKYLTKGYHENLDKIVNNALFETDNDDIVLVKNIEIFSLCEHHLLPFFGKAHIAYIPSG
ncbi:MAG: GTP cyclohydrolase I, partial [Planctomycetes bacterium]|nr:GTP cyclohydrolase I [Planctomycetota bacterium]